jgi:hypothetical protein
MKTAMAFVGQQSASRAALVAERQHERLADPSCLAKLPLQAVRVERHGGRVRLITALLVLDPLAVLLTLVASRVAEVSRLFRTFSLG